MPQVSVSHQRKGNFQLNGKTFFQSQTVILYGELTPSLHSTSPHFPILASCGCFSGVSTLGKLCNLCLS